MILIGGQALKNLGSSRNTLDHDYLINDSSKDLFTCSNKVDLLNADKSNFFMEIWNQEEGNEQASPQSLLELKAYALVEHCQNQQWQKADDCEYDIKYLVRHCGLTEIKIAQKYMTDGQAQYITGIIEAVK